MSHDNFLYKCKITVSSGNGGNGCSSFRRTRYISKGGPDGGNGGNGGNIVLSVNPHLNTLLSFKYQNNFRASDGDNGGKNNCTGKDGADKIIEIPLGTQVQDQNQIIDFDRIGMNLAICKGGKGGMGNKFFTTAESRAPSYTTCGGSAERKELLLTLKYMADIGLVGMPNAGKSTLLKILDPSSKTQIGSYQFSTIKPVLGTKYTSKGQIIIADLPGLLEGSHMGKGRGYSFLQHVERCRILLMVFDVSSTTLDNDINIISNELSMYNASLFNKKIVICLTKYDINGVQEAFTKAKYIQTKYKYPTFSVSHFDTDSISNMFVSIVDMM